MPSAASTSPISSYLAVNEGRTAGKWAARAAKHQYRQDAPRLALRLSGWLCLPVMLIFDSVNCTAGYSLFLSFLSIRPRCKSYLAKLYSISHRMSRTGILLAKVIWHGAMARGRGGMMVRLSMSSTYTNTRRASIDPKQFAISSTLCDMCLSVKGKSLFLGIYNIYICTASSPPLPIRRNMSNKSLWLNFQAGAW